MADRRPACGGYLKSTTVIDRRYRPHRRTMCDDNRRHPVNPATFIVSLFYFCTSAIVAFYASIFQSE
jgi:hypothetical protein